MGSADEWQIRVERALESEDILILNPRRLDWDSSWEQSAGDPRFREQVEWELEAQDLADVIAFYFAPGTRAPVTLLELGLAARGGKSVVCCPNGYWRKGNVDLVCERHRIPTVPALDDLVAAVRERLRR
jgi:hypothetical protein